MMRVAVGSMSDSKLQAVKLGLVLLSPDLLYGDWTAIGVDVQSGVSDQPMSDEETIEGATNRALRALDQSEADIAFGLESGLQEGVNDSGWFGTGWVAVVNRQFKFGMASTFRIAIPSKLMEHVLAGDEMAVACEKFYKVKDGKADGTSDAELITHGRLSKISMYRDTVVAAYCDLVS
jgi:inosine/xanthosine triphosphatase